MKPLQRSSIVEQCVEHLRQSLRMGAWSGRLPGVQRLAKEAGVSKLTMRAAMRVLEAEGLVVLSEDGYSRYLANEATISPRSLRIGILMSEPLSDQIGQLQQLIPEIQHQLERAGFAPFLFHQTLSSLHNDARRIGKGIAQASLDACIVVSAPQEVLKWFVEQALPCLALFGNASGLPIAYVGPDKAPEFAETVRRLVTLGHRRIVLLNHKERRLPSPGLSELAFLDELAAQGIEVSNFNLPDWDETPEGLNKLLENLFRLTPPSAMIIDEVQLWVAVMQYCAQKGIQVPEHLSLVTTDYDPVFHWCSPKVTHIRWENQPIVQRVLRWARAVNRGREDIKQVFTPAKLVPGGTIGPALPPSTQIGKQA